MLNSVRRVAPLGSWCALLAVVLLVAGIRGRLLDLPLERDEGEYAYFGQLMLGGVPPYTEAFNMKLPGTYVAYAVILAILGQTTTAIHLGLLLLNAATVVLLFLLARRWFDPPGAVTAAAAFALLSVGQPVLGLSANAEHFVLPFAVGGLLLVERNRPLLAGLLLGTAVLMKQHGVAFALAGLLFVAFGGLRTIPWKTRLVRVAWTAAGIATPYALTCLAFAATGAFGAFWFWTVEYARAYASQIPLEAAVRQLKGTALPILRGAPLLWTLASAGLPAVWLDNRSRPFAGRLSVLAGLSFLATCPGFFFRAHYFLLTLPAAALLVGATVQALKRPLARHMSPVAARAVVGILVLIAGADLLVRQRAVLFRMSAYEVVRDTYGSNPFPESVEIGRYILEHSDPDDRIAVVGSEPQILFYARRRSVTGYIYTYAMMERHEYARTMQREMIADIERGRPRYLVFVQVYTSWLRQPGAPGELFDWFVPFQQANYRPVGFAEIVPGQPTRWFWGGRGPWPPSSARWIAVFERRPDARLGSAGAGQP